ncbi:MAG TPA: hypothetical protein VGS10_19530 [Terracidiphilus sp.]|nr:hypothetical protein [Terracidiphilus sp.]
MKIHRLGIAVFINFIVVAVIACAQQPNEAGNSIQQVDPAIIDLPISASTVTDVHLHPFFTTTIRLPDAVTSVAVGAPSLFKVEHSADEPRLVFIKPTTAATAASNLIIALQSGQEISLRLLSEGTGTGSPVDFVVNYEPRQSFLIGSTDQIAGSSITDRDPPARPSAIDLALKQQAKVASPDWSTGNSKGQRNSDRTVPGKPILGALGAVQEQRQLMLVAYSVVNTSDHWIEILPPQVELRSPNLDTNKKKGKDQVLAEEVPVARYRLTARRLAPGVRADGAVEFSRPGFKQSADRLELELGTASAVDHPLLLALPFVAPGN